MAKITFDNKVDLTVKPIPEINKVTASNINEIKTVVNGLDDNKISINSSLVFSSNTVPFNATDIRYYNTELASSFTTYILGSGYKLGDYVKFRINTTTNPTVYLPDGITPIDRTGGQDWETGVDFDLIIEIESAGGVNLRPIYFLAKR